MLLKVDVHTHYLEECLKHGYTWGRYQGTTPVINTIDPTTAQITLTSCEPKWSAERRIIVRGVLNEEKSAPVGDATFYDLDVDAGTSAGTPTTAPAPTTATSSRSRTTPR